MARKIEDQYTTTANVDAVRAAYGDDDNAKIEEVCWKCSGSGRIAYYGHVEGGRCFACGGTGDRRMVSVGTLITRAKRRDAADARKARKAAAERTELEAWKTANADLLARAEAVEADWFKSWKYAPNAEQVENLTNAVVEREARKAADEARKATATPVPTGKATVTGVVVSWKEAVNRFSYYAETILKVVVEDGRGFRVFGTCPAKLVEAVDGDMDALKGAMVTFNATLEPSKDDELFGFFKRPTKVALLDGSED